MCKGDGVSIKSNLTNKDTILVDQKVLKGLENKFKPFKPLSPFLKKVKKV